METDGQIKSQMWKARAFGRPLSRFIDIILPPPGSLTGPGFRMTDAHIWQHVKYLDDPCCKSCGYPFEYDRGEGADCARCMVDPPDYDSARAAIYYHEDSCSLVLAFKHAGRTVNLKRFAQQMARAGRGFWPGADILVPVPLHKSRLVKRRYNQAALLAGATAKLTFIAHRPDVLVRHKETASQGIQTAKGRFRNVQGAFTVPQNLQDDIKGKTIVLIDDVYTTGATLGACARTLRRAGADKVYAVTLARVVKDQEIPT